MFAWLFKRRKSESASADAASGADDKQWRLDNAAHLKGQSLEFQPYRRWSETWDHDHCSACWATFAEIDGEDIQHEGYATTDEFINGARYEWICKACFADLMDDLGWEPAKRP